MSEKCGSRMKHRRRYGHMEIKDPNILSISGENVTETSQKNHGWTYLSGFLNCCCVVGKEKCFIILADIY